MMTLRKKTLAAAMVLAIASGAAFAAEKGKNVGATKKGANGADNRVVAQLAMQLAQYGDKNKDALALITAAKMQVQIGVQASTAVKETAKGEAVQADAGKKALDPTAKGLLDRAKQYAGDRKDLIALADDVAAAGSRGLMNGPALHEDVVSSGATDSYALTFRGGELARVALSGDGDTDLDLSIYDENGNAICSSARTGDDEYCEFTPRWTGRFLVRVKNYGGVYNRYELLMN